MNKTGKLDWKKVDPLIIAALNEDMGIEGDLTTMYTVPGSKEGRGSFLLKADGVIAGLPVAERVFHTVSKRISFSALCSDGESHKTGKILGTVSGPLAGILIAERTALNFIQRMSGIATLTARFVKSVRGTRVKIMDTRKTTPCMRYLEKYSVQKGGGYNHRYGLYDMILIKDNHVTASGSIQRAIESCFDRVSAGKRDIFIEIEVRNLAELKIAIQYPVHRIMLDNMSLSAMRKAVRIVGEKIPLEASGNVTLENVRQVAETGVDMISVGALTHSSRSLDISMEIE